MTLAQSFRKRFPTRIDLLGLITCIGLLGGIAMSWRLWFPLGRSFPAVPILIPLPAAVSFALSALLVISIIYAIVKKYYVHVVILLAVLILLDQARLQPWVYQYWLILLLTAIKRDSKDVRSQQVIVASLYFWSGVQKLNFNFHQEVLPQLLSSLSKAFTLHQKQLLILGILVAVTEAAMGLGLLLSTTRKVFVWVAIAMHVTVLALLISLQYNSVVWVWNMSLVLIVLTLFWRNERTDRRGWSNTNLRSRVAQGVVICAVCLPVLNFWSLWDRYLSGALYSGLSPIGVIRVEQRVVDRLSVHAKQVVFVSASGEQFLPLLEWSVRELNVPPYPEDRVFKGVARQLCEAGENSSQIELIVRKEPHRLSKEFEVMRWNCLTLKE